MLNQTKRRGCFNAAALTLALCAGGTANAQTINAAPFAGPNGGTAGGLNFFNIHALHASGVTIYGMDVNTTAAVSGYKYTVYTCPTDYTPNTVGAGAWSVAATGNFGAIGTDLHSYLNFSTPLAITSGTTIGVAVRLADPANTGAAALRYTTGTGLVTFANADIALELVGQAENVAFVGPPFTPRWWNGTAYYAPTGSATGACCAENGTCSVVSQASCTGSGGIFRGTPTCAQANCPTATGKCCTGATCAVNTQGTCLAGGGAWTAGDTCASGCVTGRCCKTDGTCSITTQSGCTGFWGGPASVCAADCNGPCCATSGTCADTQSWTACAASGGIYRGPAADATCGTLVVACAPELFFDDGRTDNSIGFQAAVSTTWCNKFVSVAGQESMNRIRVNFGTTGALNGQTATVQLYADNGTAAGNPSGATVIAGATATATIKGAGAAFPNATPLWVDFDLPDTTITAGTTFYAAVTAPVCAANDFPAGCDSSSFVAGRAWIGTSATGTVPTIFPAATDITTVPLNYSWMIRVDTGPSGGTGACCLASGTCVPGQTNAQCAAQSGVFTGGSCSPNPCPQPYACCFDDGSCSNLQPAACTAALGVPHAVVGTQCGAGACGQPGACCKAAGVCVANLNQHGCLKAGGVFTTAGTTCPPSPACSNQYFEDDGARENQLGINAAAASVAWLNRFTVTNGLNNIASVAIAFGANGAAATPTTIDGLPVTIYIWSDPNNDGNPADAVVLSSVAGTVSNSNTNTLNTFTFASPVNVGANGTNFFVGAIFTETLTTGTGVFPSVLDQSFSQGKSWFTENNTATPVDPNALAAVHTVLLGTIDSLGFPGNWLIRANPVAAAVCYANCDNSTTCPVVNTGDFTCFLQQYSAGVQLPSAGQQTHYANCDGSTTFPQVNTGDFTCFLQKYAANCSGC